MANANRPAGLVPLEYLNGTPYNGKGRVYSIASNNTDVFAIGDPVTLSGTADANGVAGVALATAGGANLVLGSVLGLGGSVYGGPGAVPGSLESTVIPATKTRVYYVLVSDDPNIVYVIQEQNSGTPLAATDVGLNCSLVSGTNSGYVSGWQLDNSTEATTQALQLKLLGLHQVPDNTYGLLAKWKVLINNHQFSDGQAGV